MILNRPSSAAWTNCALLLDDGGRAGRGPVPPRSLAVSCFLVRAITQILLVLGPKLRADRLQRQPRMDRRRAVADQAGEVVDVPGVAALDDQVDPHAGAGRDQVVVDRPDRHQRRDRRAVRADRPVRDDQDRRALLRPPQRRPSQSASTPRCRPAAPSATANVASSVRATSGSRFAARSVASCSCEQDRARQAPAAGRDRASPPASSGAARSASAATSPAPRGAGRSAGW